MWIFSPFSTDISGAIFNPAVATGPLFVSAIVYDTSSDLQWIWLYYLAPILGAAFAAFMFRVLAHHKEYATNEEYAYEPVQ